MSRLFFISLLFFAALVRIPLSLLLIVLKNLAAPLNSRIKFERKNLIEEESRSFKLSLSVADYCFEISSEGELEQVRPLIEYYLTINKKIEILFSSPSVESKCIKLARDYSSQVRILRMPIASFWPVNFLYFQSPWTWVSAPVIVFCRYDFFPELLSFKFLGKKLILLSATGKNPSWFKHECHKLFSLIVAANEVEARFFGENYKNLNIMSFDFRLPRIFKRLKMADQALSAVSELAPYLNFLSENEFKMKFIMGSAWESDLAILNHPNWQDELKNGNCHLLIVPHDLGPKSIECLKQSLKQLMPEVPNYEIKKEVPFDALVLKTKPGIVILNLSGVLCELYSKFSLAYVGGGYERSIHSVLEPFLSGNQVFVGPKIKRSTEFDFIKELAPGEIHLLKNPESFYTIIKNNAYKTLSMDLRSNLSANGQYVMEAIIKEIEQC